MSQSSSTEGLNKRMKDLKSRKEEANPGGVQIYKVLKVSLNTILLIFSVQDKLTEFDLGKTRAVKQVLSAKVLFWGSKPCGKSAYVRPGMIIGDAMATGSYGLRNIKLKKTT